MFIQITQVWAHYFKLFNRVQSIQDEKARFIKGNGLKLNYFHSPFFKRVHCLTLLTRTCTAISGLKKNENRIFSSLSKTLGKIFREHFKRSFRIHTIALFKWFWKKKVVFGLLEELVVITEGNFKHFRISDLLKKF